MQESFLKRSEFMAMRPVMPFIMMRGAKEFLKTAAPGIAQTIEKYMQEHGKLKLQFIISEKDWSKNTFDDLSLHLQYLHTCEKDNRLNPTNMGEGRIGKTAKEKEEESLISGPKNQEGTNFSKPPRTGAESQAEVYQRVSECVMSKIKSCDSDTLMIFVTHDKPLESYFKGLKHAGIFTDCATTPFLRERFKYGELFMMQDDQGKLIAVERKI
jgi:hypothetical protein